MTLKTPLASTFFQIAFSVVFFCAQKAALIAADPLIIVTFGDSVTAPRGGTVVYSDLLAKELSFADRDIKIINAGIGGHTTKNGKGRFQKDVLDAKPDVVVIMYGINDAAVDVWRKPPAKTPRVPLVDYRKNITGMIRTLKKQGVRVVLMNSNPIHWATKTKQLYGKPPYKPDDVGGFNVLLRDYVAAVRQIAKMENVGLVDVFAAFEAHDADPKHKAGSLTPDGMHPGNEGHRIIADLLIKHLIASDKRFTRQSTTD
jgi:lysophospholipase L1-like esterase